MSVCSLQAHALAFHVHAAPDHSGMDRHSHAPAIHHHDHADDLDGTLHLEADEESEGAVITVVVPPMTARASIDGFLELADSLGAPLMQVIGEARAIEVRSHGPPPARDAALRGPPVSTLL